MGHEIETYTTEDGTVLAAAAFARQPAWHRLGTTFTEDLSAEDVLERAYLGGWDVAVDEHEARDNLGLAIPNYFAVTRQNPFTHKREPLGVVGRIFRPFQNEDAVDTLNALRDQTNGRFETAGSLRDGRQVFITAKMPDHMLIGGVDGVDRYLTSINWHDGSGAWSLLDTRVRVVCANTADAAMSGYRSKVTIRHTANGKDSIASLRAGLDITFKFDQAFEAEAEKMIQATMTESAFVKTVRRALDKPSLWPVPRDKQAKRAEANYRERERKLVELWNDSPTIKEIRGTRWAGYNVVTEYLDWFAPVRSGADADKVRALRTISPESYVGDIKIAAFDAFKVPAPRAPKKVTLGSAA